MAYPDRRYNEMIELAAVQQVKSAVDEVLMSPRFFHDLPYARLFAGKLSTSPITTSSEITPELLKGKCGVLSDEILDRLDMQQSTSLDMKISDHPKATSGHKYLSTTYNGIEVIIDASIGQYVKGHTHVFVGTRDKLKKLILGSRGNIINTQRDLANNPEEFFRRTWGIKKGKVWRNGNVAKVPA